ncbi:retrovirus-related pol polyprotein from transposon TNT 1-94 [Tanacetum coccineum]
MTEDRSQLTNFVNKFLGTVKFGNDHVAKILGYGDYQIRNVTISRVYYVEGLGHNLFSFGQFCDSNLEVAFRLHTCFIRDANSINSFEPTPSGRPTKVKVPKELPKVSMVNTSLKKFKHYLAGFDVVVKERTTATAITEAQSQEKDTVIIKLKDRIKSLSGKMNEDKIKKDLEEIETINIELDHRVSKLEKVSVITTLKNELRKLKGKAVVDNDVTKHTIDSEMLKIDVEPITPKFPFTEERQLSQSYSPIAQTARRGNHSSIWERGIPSVFQCSISLFVLIEWRLRYNPVTSELRCVQINSLTDMSNNSLLSSRISMDEWPVDCDQNIDNTHVGSPTTRSHISARNGLVRGLPKLKFEKDHLCSACAMGKSKKKPYKPKSEDTNKEKLYLSHMDLCGPMRVTSVNGKKYILVIVDDYSRFTWVKCLRSKDKAPDFIIKFLKMIQKVGISHETSVALSPQQNGVVKRHNHTLIEAAHTMLIYEKALLLLWAEAIATACYTQNHSIIRLRHGKTPYELLHDKLPDLSFFHVFGALSPSKEGISNLPTYVPDYHRTIHVDFDELTAMASEHSCLGPALHEMTHATISSGLVPNPPPSTPFVPPSRTVSPEPIASTGSPSSKTIDQDAPSPSNSPIIHPKLNPPIKPIDVLIEDQS